MSRLSESVSHATLLFILVKMPTSFSECFIVIIWMGWAQTRWRALFGKKKNPNLAIAEAQQLGAGVAEAFQRPKSAAEARGPVWGYGRPDV